MSLELGARNGLIPHYLIGEQIRFDPKDLDRWVREHLDGVVRWADSEEPR
jgi:hypothetical protein